MKEYISRLRGGCKLHTFLYWSLLRLLMLYAFFVYLFTNRGLGEDITAVTGMIHIIVCFFASFLWELSQAMPKKSLLRFMPASIHTALNTGLFISSFFGVLLNWYYEIKLFDPLITAFFGVWSVLYGYEIAYAAVKKYHFAATKAMVFFAAFGISFIFLNICELGEFISDQMLGLVTGTVGNAQFWSAELAGSAGAESFIPAIDSARYPLMDIMADIVIHTVSAFAALIFINVCPYRLRGKYKYDIDYDNNYVKTPESERDGESYIQRLKDNCTPCTYAFWWVIRLAMVGMFIKSLFDKPFSPVISVEILMNLGVMFTWEVCMAMPKWTVFPYVRPVMQTAIAVVDFIAVVAGYLFNFYYEVRLWDSFLHFMCGLGIVFFGYEFACALIRKEKKTTSRTLILIASVGFCFMATTFWEIFEFSCDQIVGMMSGTPHDVQHWSYAKALGTPKFQTLIDYIDINRYPIMDTMGDIVLNTVGAVLGALGLKIYPYRHKGRFRLDYVIYETEEK